MTRHHRHHGFTRARRVFVVLLASFGLLAAGDANFVFVVLDRATVKAEPSHFSKTVGWVFEGQQLTAISARDGWVEVGDGRQSGFIRENAIRDKQQNRDWSKVFGLPASQRDIYAAQKGFGPEVERMYGTETAVDYGPVDRMIAFPSISDPLAQLLEFRRAGRLGEFAQRAEP